MDRYFLGWGTLILINAALASIDGRSPLKYFLGSLLFGPFATLLIAVTRETEGGRLELLDLWKGKGPRR